MKLSQRVCKRIEALSAPGRIEEQMDQTRVTVDVEAVDRLGMLVRRVELEKTEAPAGPIETVLRRQAQAVTDKIAYLDGELKVIEVDGVHKAAQLRSKRPYKDDGGTEFIEVKLRGGNSVSVERRKGQNPASFHVSKDELGRLVGDLEDVI